MKWTLYGPNALLVYFADKHGNEAYQRCQAICRELEHRPFPGLREFVPAFTSILLQFDAGVVPDPRAIATDVLARFEAALELDLPPVRIREIPVVYNGPDLARVADLNKLSIQDVIERHTAPLYKVYMLGFSPGFPYLGDLDSRLHTPRLSSPRPQISPGSVAIGGEHTGIYTVKSPGGWNIIGHTHVQLFKPDEASAESMFFLHPGDQVRFVATAAGIPGKST